MPLTDDGWVSEPSAWDEWSSLSAQERVEVARLSRKGKRHPDPRVAASAERWARVILDSAEVDKADRFTPAGIFGGVVAAAIAVFAALWPDDQFGREWAERRWARRVLAAK